MFALQRHPASPLLFPDPASDWETYNVFNPAVIHHQGLFHMLYRAQGLDWISRLGYAISADGLTWNRLRRPVLTPHDATDDRGIEDPRLTWLDGEFYLTYTAYGSRYQGAGAPTHAGGGVTPMLARSRNLVEWERIGPLVVGEDNKDHLLFPRRLGGQYLALHRRPPAVWLARSDDLQRWPEAGMQPVFGPRPANGWDSLRVGANGVPIEIGHGWLLLYHAYDPQHVYRFGVCLLDRENPQRVLRRPAAFIFEPAQLWELRGDVPNVVFSCANPLVGDTVYVYYGGADHVIGLATCSLNDLLEFALHAPQAN